MENAAKSVTLWASTQNSLLMPWLIVEYALCTTLADHTNTHSTGQTTRRCPRCEAKVKVAALWQTAYSDVHIIVLTDITWSSPEIQQVDQYRLFYNYLTYKLCIRSKLKLYFSVTSKDSTSLGYDDVTKTSHKSVWRKTWSLKKKIWGFTFLNA